MSSSCDSPKSPYRVQSVFDAFGVLETLVTAKQPMTASQIASVVHDSRNRCFRLLKTLEECGYVIHSPSDRTYRPSLKLLTLGQSVSRRQSIEVKAKEVMRNLCDRIGETVYLTVREGFESVCVANIESTQMVHIAAQPGSRWELGRGATGEVLLATAPRDVREGFFIEKPEMFAVYQKARERFESDGVSYVDGREGRIADDGVLAMGVPVFDSSGEARHALAVAWPYTRSSIDYESLRLLVINAARAIETELGVQHHRMALSR